MMRLALGTIVKRWLDLMCHALSKARMEARTMLVTVFLKKNKDIRDYFRPVFQKLCNKYLGEVEEIIDADLPYMVPGDEEESLGALGEIVEL